MCIIFLQLPVTSLFHARSCWCQNFHLHLIVIIYVSFILPSITHLQLLHSFTSFLQDFMKSVSSKKGIVTLTSRNDVRDPFGSSPPFEKTYGSLWKYIPKLTQDQVPDWLKKLVIRCFHGETTVEAMAAHSLHRQIFEANEHDCRSIPEMQRIGETIACFKPVKSNELCTSSAVSAKDRTKYFLNI